MTRGEAELCQEIRALLAEASALFDRLVEPHRAELQAALRQSLAGRGSKRASDALLDLLTQCRNEIVACFLPPDLGAWLRERAIHFKAQNAAPVLLPPPALKGTSEPAVPSQADPLKRFKDTVKAVQARFWELVGLPHPRPDGSRADKRTLLVQYAGARGLGSQAEDLADETLIKALNRLYQFEPRPGKHFMNWLYTLAWSTLVDACRRGAREATLDPEAAARTADPREPGQRALEEIAAVMTLSGLMQTAAEDPAGVPKALICFFHRVLEYKPREIVEELGDFTLSELLAAFRAACLRLEAFDQDEGLVDELVRPLRERLGAEADTPLARSWEGQKRADYYIQNVSRRTWQRVVEGVRAQFPGAQGVTERHDGNR